MRDHQSRRARRALLDFRTTSEERRIRRNSAGEEIVEVVPIETWTYNRGSTQLIRYLTFRNGYLTRIQTGDYGY